MTDAPLLVTIELSKRAEDLWVQMQSHRHPIPLLAQALAAEAERGRREAEKPSTLDWD